MTMKTLTATLVAILLSAGLMSAQSGSFTMPYTALQRLGIEFVLDSLNTDRSEQDPPLPSIALITYGRSVCGSVFDSYVSQRAQEWLRSTAIVDKILVLSDVDKVMVEALIDSLANP